MGMSDERIAELGVVLRRLAESDVRTYECTGELRFARPNRTTSKPDRLQQKWIWRSHKEAGIEWRDVPLVIVDDPE